jgi:hypothetical protein
MRLEIRQRASPRPVAQSEAELDGLVHSMDETRDRPRIIIRTLKGHDQAAFWTCIALSKAYNGGHACLTPHTHQAKQT